MTKYKNISNMRIMAYAGNQVIPVDPGQVVELTSIPEDAKKFFAVEEVSKPMPHVLSDIKEANSTELPEDYLVIISDKIVEDLKKEQTSKSTKPKGRPRKRRARD